MSERQILVLLGKWASRVLMLLVLSNVALPPLLVPLVLLLLLLAVILRVISTVPLSRCLVHILVLGPHRAIANMKLIGDVRLHHVIVGVLLVHHGFLSRAVGVI